MKLLQEHQIYETVSQFQVDRKLRLIKSAIIGPDDALYYLSSSDGKQYGLLCRDYIGDLDIERRILEKEFQVSIAQWIENREADKKWFNDPEADVVNYLVRIRFKQDEQCSAALFELN